MEPIARLGDPSDHGGFICQVQTTNITADGILVCVLGDWHSCPIPTHGITQMVSASAVSKANNIPLCRVTDKAACGAAVNVGSPTSQSA
jgi:uncharacterized Zn-binding protein involved in type VI secretion